MRKYGTSCAVLIGVAMIVAWVPRADAYPVYSAFKIGDIADGFCATCHGDFRASPYERLGEDRGWGTDLMSGHLSVVSDCGVCHGSSANYPVETFSSAGSGGRFIQSCLGCHGVFQSGLGSTESSGLRQRHFRAGVTECASCHNLDSDPSVYTPESEASLPPNYDLDLSVVALTDPCNRGGVGEDFAGDSAGLDNDGDQIYDALDPDCATPTATPTPTPATATPTPATPSPATPTPTPAGDCSCIPTRVIPGGAVAAFGSAPDNGNGKGTSLARSFSVALAARDREPGSCTAGAVSRAVDLRLELLDDDGDAILDAVEPAVVCTSGAATVVKFAVEFALPDNCRGSELPRNTSRGDIHFKATTADGSLELTRSLLCKWDPRSGD